MVLGIKLSASEITLKFYTTSQLMGRATQKSIKKSFNEGIMMDVYILTYSVS